MLSRVEVPECDRLWMAGFFDGEGCIGTIMIETANRSWPISKKHFTPYISIVNTEEKLLQLFPKYFSGHVYRRKKLKPKSSQVFHYQIRHFQRVIPFILTLLPYVKSKKRLKMIEILRIKPHLLSDEDRKLYQI